MDSSTKFPKIFLISLVAAATLYATEPPPNHTAAPKGTEQIERGRYIVEDLVKCERCHTPRDERGDPDLDRWLMGGPVKYRPTYPAKGWADVAPRIAGDPPGTEEEFIRLMTTGIARTGSPPREPMLRLGMSRADAEAVRAYLKSLTPRVTR